MTPVETLVEPKQQKTLDPTQPQNVTYCIPIWLRDEQVRLNTATVKNRIEPSYEIKTEAIAIVCFGPSLIETWERVKDFKYIITCSGAHKFLVDRGIIPTWHTEVDPRPHKIKLIGAPHKDVEYLIASACHPDVFKHLAGCNVKLWHIFDANEEPMRILPPGEWALTGGCGAGLRAMALARFLGFKEQHIFGMDGNYSSQEKTGSHAGEHPNQAPPVYEAEYEGVKYRTTPAFAEAARQTFHELDALADVEAKFYGKGLVQAMARNYVRKPPAPGTAMIAFNKPELISNEYRELNSKLHTERLDYGVGGGKYGQTVIKLVESLKGDSPNPSVLDYGCGKGYLAKELPFPIWEYDPAVPEKSLSPRPAELVVCTDVLEHIEPEKLEFVLDDLRRCVRKIGYFVINTGPAKKTYADGRNTHLIQKDKNWWQTRLKKYFTVASIIEKGAELHIIVSVKDKTTEDLPDGEIAKVSHKGTSAKFLVTNEITKYRVDSLFVKEPITIEWIERMKSGDVLIDVGANVGSYSIWSAQRGVRVFAFEPAARNYELLCSNIVLNGLEDKITAYCAALSSVRELGVLQLSSMQPGMASHQFGQANSQKKVQGCVALTLDELVTSGQIPQPTHIKIDVDGLEPKVIIGAKKTLRKVSSVLVETNVSLEPHQLMVEQLKAHGFSYRPHQVEQACRKEGNFKGVAEYLFTRERDEVERLVDKILNAEIIQEPFPHLYIKGIFSQRFYDELQANLTEGIEYKAIAAVRPTAGYPARSVHDPKTDFWKGIDTLLRDGRLKSAVGAKLNCYDPKFVDETLLIRDAEGYSIGPHTDSPQKIATLLFYLPKDDRISFAGTSLYKPKEEGFVCGGGPHYEFDKFNKVKTAPFFPNSLFAFAKSNISFHGVEPLRVESKLRHSLLYDIRREK